MKKVIVTHATKSQEEIVEMNWQERFQNPVPYHHIMNSDGTIRKGRADHEVCGHCGRWPGNSHSKAYTRGVTAKSGIFRKRECPEIGFCSFFVYKFQRLSHVGQSFADIFRHIIKCLVCGNAHRFAVVAHCIFGVCVVSLLTQENAY